MLAKNKVVGIILSGGPHSVYEAGSPHVHKEVWRMIEEQSLPVLGICYGMQEIAHVFGGKVAPGLEREYGKATVSHIAANKAAGEPLIGDLPDNFQMWMSHGDKLHNVPEVQYSCISIVLYICCEACAVAAAAVCIAMVCISSSTTDSDGI
jgi:GMP synthase (glutamine-hydrolysing)